SDAARYSWGRTRAALLASALGVQPGAFESRTAFLTKVEQEAQRTDDIPRPKRWGGYRVWAERVELWVGQPGRAPDRSLWTRSLAPSDSGFTGGAWGSTRLQP